jgi:hypothetical protein
MGTNWKQVGIEVEFWSIPDRIVHDFEDHQNVGQFRAECRKIDISEDAIDFAINHVEQWRG